MKTVFVVIDSETTRKNGLVFDFGWTSFDRSGKVYGTGSYIAKDVLALDDPLYKHKVARYWDMAYNREIEPLAFGDIRQRFNDHLKEIIDGRCKPILCAYNAAFDTRVLALTSFKMLEKRFLDHRVHLLDIWDAWATNCPKRYSAEVSPSGNVRTTAESVYRYETGQPTFEEAHIAFPDTQIERVILERVLRRKKKLPVVTNPKDFHPRPWKKVQDRVRKKIGPDVVRDLFQPEKV